MPDTIPSKPPEEPIHAAIGAAVTAGTPPNSEYSANGLPSLTDGKMGSDDHFDPEWMGWWYMDKPFEATIDLGKSQPIRSVAVHALMASESWIFLPKEVVFEVSRDGENFREVGKVQPTKDDFENEVPETRMLLANDLREVARFVRVRAERYGELPDWHLGYGGADGYEGQAWLFLDEILVNVR